MSDASEKLPAGGVAGGAKKSRWAVDVAKGVPSLYQQVSSLYERVPALYEGAAPESGPPLGEGEGGDRWSVSSGGEEVFEECKDAPALLPPTEGTPTAHTHPLTGLFAEEEGGHASSRASLPPGLVPPDEGVPPVYPLQGSLEEALEALAQLTWQRREAARLALEGGALPLLMQVLQQQRCARLAPPPGTPGSNSSQPMLPVAARTGHAGDQETGGKEVGSFPQAWRGVRLDAVAAVRNILSQCPESQVWIEPPAEVVRRSFYHLLLIGRVSTTMDQEVLKVQPGLHRWNGRFSVVLSCLAPFLSHIPPPFPSLPPSPH